MADVETTVRLDGNAAAAILAEIFEAEMTLARVACPACQSTWWIGECHAYLGGPGTILRCRGCGALLLAVVRRGTISCVDLRGVLD